MLETGLIKLQDDGTLIQAVANIKTSEDVSSKALQASHVQTLDFAKEKLLTIDVLQRDFSSILVPTDPKNLTEAKKLIREFRHKMEALLKDGDKTELYQLAIQLFPMTDTQGVSQ